jgi:hypothetical protein
VRRALTLFVALAAAVNAAAQMPDPKQMSGLPLPVADMAPGTVSVRVVKGALTNVVKDQPVVLTGVGTPITVKTNDTGRAEFTTLTPGSRVRVETTIGSEKIVSQDFDVPRAGGIRLMLVATDPDAAGTAAAAQMPAQPGTVVFGEESRIVIEAGDDGLNVFNIFQIVNMSSTPVQTAPLVFELPEAGEQAAVLEGSSKQAVLAGKRVTVSGPFAPGPTLVQFAYSIPFGDASVTIEQKLPAALRQVSVVAQKVGDMRLASPQLARQRDMAAEQGTYIFGQGPALKAGDTIALSLTGLPHEPKWPRNIALALASLILVAGAWAAFRSRRPAPSPAVSKLAGRRDRLFGELLSLEQEQRRGAVAADVYEARRRDLVAALEKIYAQMDEDAAA